MSAFETAFREVFGATASDFSEDLKVKLRLLYERGRSDDVEECGRRRALEQYTVLNDKGYR